MRDLTCDELNKHIFNHYNYDCKEGYQDLMRVVHRERMKRLYKDSSIIWIGMTGFSAYNLSRISALTGQGRVLAGLGLAFGGLNTIGSLTA